MRSDSKTRAVRAGHDHGRGRSETSLRQSAALVLRRYRYAETSLLVHLLTPDHGKIGVLAKGAFRPTSGYAGVLDFFDTLQLSYRRSPRSELGLLTAGSVERRRFAICRDLGRYRAGLSILELAGLGAREEHAERALFALVEAALDALARGDAQHELISVVFELQFLAAQGLSPALSECASCGRSDALEANPRGDAVFSPALGGRLCTRCAAEASSGSRRALETLPASAIRVAQSLIDAPLSVLPRIRLDSARTDRLRSFVRRFLEYHLESRPRVWESSSLSASRPNSGIRHRGPTNRR